MTHTVLLGDIAEVLGGGTPATKNKEYWGGPIPWITPRDLSKHESVYIDNGERSITEQGLANSSAKLFPAGSVIFSSRAPIGYVTIASQPMTTNQGCKGIVCDDRRLYNKYLFYWLKLNKSYIESLAGGSTFKEISTTGVRGLQLILPDLDVQKKIANTLVSIDEKIELNRKMNETLEQMGQALFRHYFIDSPEAENWESTKVGDIAEVTDYVANGSFASLKANVTLFDEPEYALFVRTTDFKRGFNGGLKYTDKKSYDFLKKSMLLGREFIISNVGDTGTVFRPPVWLCKPMTLGSNAIMVKDSKFNSYLYQYFRSNDGQFAISNIVAGSAQPKFNKTEFRNLKVNKPDDMTLIQFNKSFTSIEENIVSNIAQIQTLITLRDTLLPRLISGKTSV